MKEQLKTLRKSKGLTQSDIAKIIDVKLSTYQKYERDVVSPSYDTLLKIASFYGVTTDYLLGRETNVTEPLEQLASKFNMTELEKNILIKYLALSRNVRSEMIDFLYSFVKEIQDEKK